MLAFAQSDIRIETKEAIVNGDSIIVIQSTDAGDGSQKQAFTKKEMAFPNKEAKNKDKDNIKNERKWREKAENNEFMANPPKSEIKNVENTKPNQEIKKNENKEQSIKPNVANNPQNQPMGQPNAPGGDDLNKYISVIAEKNLFMPLGYVKREEKPNYAVTGIISNTSEELKPKAIIEQMGANRSFYVAEGDMVAGDAKVTDIQADQVKLNRSGEDMMLKLGVGTQGGGGGGPNPSWGRPPSQNQSGDSNSAKRASRSSGGPKGNVSGEPNLDNLPPFVRKMLEEKGISIEELKNNPELRQKLRQEFQQQFGGRVPTQ